MHISHTIDAQMTRYPSLMVLLEYLIMTNTTDTNTAMNMTLPEPPTEVTTSRNIQNPSDFDKCGAMDQIPLTKIIIQVPRPAMIEATRMLASTNRIEHDTVLADTARHSTTM